MSVYGDYARREVAALVPLSVGSLLDVGCASGGFGEGLMEERPNLTVWGVESDRGDAAIAAKRYEHVVEGLFPCDVGRRFDCVTFNDVLEHMADPSAALRVSVAHLNPGGVIVASIPNVRYWPVVIDLALRGRWDYADTGVLDRTHLRFFTRASIESLFDEAGLRVTEIRGLSPIRFRRRARPLARLIPADMRFLQYGVVARSSTSSTPRAARLAAGSVPT